LIRVCLFVDLLVGYLKKNYRWIFVKVGEWVDYWLHCGNDPEHIPHIVIHVQWIVD